MPCSTYRLTVGPNGLWNWNPLSAREIAFFSSFVHQSVLIIACACSVAAFCVKCTTYTGARPPRTMSARTSCSGFVEYVISSGTGRVTPRTSATVRFVRSARSARIAVVSPSVADSRRNVAFGKVSSGICHAIPRSRSA